MYGSTLYAVEVVEQISYAFAPVKLQYFCYARAYKSVKIKLPKLNVVFTEDRCRHEANIITLPLQINDQLT